MTAWNIQRVKLSELENFFQEYSNLFTPVLPITPERILSYLNNPRAKDSDVVLYFIHFENQIIAFRTVWPDYVQSTSGPLRFGWCSGNWVSSENRRKGISLLLLKEMYADWDGKLMFTNYAPESEKGYLKSGLFSHSLLRKGQRFYFNVTLNELYEGRNMGGVNKLILLLLNLVYRLVYSINKVLFSSDGLRDFEITETSEFGKSGFIAPPSIYGRTEADLNWIFNYPWLSENTEINKSYPFSWNEMNFGYRFVTLKNKDDRSVSFVLSNRNGMIKMLYWNSSENDLGLIALWLVNYCFKQKIKIVTILDHDLALHVSRISNPFVWKKDFEMHIYSTFDLKGNNSPVYDGDGDYIFT